MGPSSGFSTKVISHGWSSRADAVHMRTRSRATCHLDCPGALCPDVQTTQIPGV